MNKLEEDQVEIITKKIGEVIVDHKPSPSVLIHSLSHAFIRGCVAAQITEDEFTKIVIELATIYEDCKNHIHKAIYQNADELMEIIKARRESKQ